jgi:uncharacterized protein (TIGR03067 family)
VIAAREGATMTKTCRALVVLAVIAVVGFAPAPLPKRERLRVDPTDVDGTWEFVLWEYSGMRSEGSEQMYWIEMTREKYDFVPKRGGGRSEYKMRLDPTASPPAFTWSMGNNVRFVGSYRLERDRMTMIFASGQDLAQRPRDFQQKQVPYRFVMKRVRR